MNAEALSGIVAAETFVTALFYDDSKESAQVTQELEKIDDEADVFKIRFVKIRDEELADEYSLSDIPALVYFRNGIPVVYDGDLKDEDEVCDIIVWKKYLEVRLVGNNSIKIFCAPSAMLFCET